ncbi:Sensor protein CitS [Phycisphaerales bacterium]|nr:Sensor protein CitS [Phycisphaerales bacterium]
MSTPRNSQSPTPEATFAHVDRLGDLLCEMRSLLDGSRRLVERAKQELSERASTLATGGAGDVARDLAATAQSLERMAELVHAAMQNASSPIGSPALQRARPVTLGEAVAHAVEVLAPLATRKTVRLSIQTGPAVDALPAGALYTVILNGLQNAIESVAARGGEGNVRVSVRPDAAPQGVGYGRDARDWYLLEITDDGVGAPSDATRCFDLGYTTKPKGAGVGLAVARSVVQGMGGTIELQTRPHTGGAVLRVRFPSLTRAANLVLGGAA